MLLLFSILCSEAQQILMLFGPDHSPYLEAPLPFSAVHMFVAFLLPTFVAHVADSIS